MDNFRALVRPIIGICFAIGILVMTIMLVSKFGNIEFAKQFVTFVLASGATVIGFYFGERSQRSK